MNPIPQIKVCSNIVEIPFADLVATVDNAVAYTQREVERRFREIQEKTSNRVAIYDTELDTFSRASLAYTEALRVRAALIQSRNREHLRISHRPEIKCDEVGPV